MSDDLRMWLLVYASRFENGVGMQSPDQTFADRLREAATRLTAAEAEVARLREAVVARDAALAPFAAVADDYSPNEPDDLRVLIDMDVLSPALTLGLFRRAAAATRLSPPEGAGRDRVKAVARANIVQEVLANPSSATLDELTAAAAAIERMKAREGEDIDEWARNLAPQLVAAGIADDRTVRHFPGRAEVAVLPSEAEGAEPKGDWQWSPEQQTWVRHPSEAEGASTGPVERFYTLSGDEPFKNRAAELNAKLAQGDSK